MTMEDFDLDVSIIGGGIAGLCLAKQFEKYGIDYCIFEKRDDFKSGGIGFIVLENGIKALKTLGLFEAFKSISSPLHSFELQDQAGETMREMNINEAHGVKRADFLDLLYKSIDPSKIVFSKKVEHVEVGAEGISKITFSDTSEIRSRYYFACDGNQSQIRNALFKQNKLNAVSMLEIINFCHDQKECKKLQGRFLKTSWNQGKKAIGGVSVPHDCVVWYLQLDALQFDREIKNKDVFKAFMSEHTRGWNDWVDSMVQHTDFEYSYLWRVRDMKPLEHIQRNNTILLGDAAHPFLTLPSQGANTAMEDVVLLSEAMVEDESKPWESVFQSFEKLRKPVYKKHFTFGRQLLGNFLKPIDDQDFMVPLGK